MDFEFETYVKIGKNIKKYRLERNLSQEKLAEFLGVNSKFIGHVERVERYISLRKLIHLSFVLNIPLCKLCDFDDLD